MYVLCVCVCLINLLGVLGEEQLVKNTLTGSIGQTHTGIFWCQDMDKLIREEKQHIK